MVETGGGTSGGSVRVEQGCRDCEECTNSEVADLGRNSGRATTGLVTTGVSEVGMRALAEECRTCDHQLSRHRGADARTPQPGCR